MNVLFNNIVLKHNIDDKYDGVYRLQNFVGKYANTNIDFDVLPYIEKVHFKEYIDSVINECKINGGLASVNLTPGSYDALIISVGLSILASKQGDFALTRPPGHHAHKNYGAGFCIYNNMAIACKNLLSEGKRVAVLDLDGHRGDGTQDILKDENNFFHCSLHQKNAYPGPGEFYSNNAINIALENPVERGELDHVHRVVIDNTNTRVIVALGRRDFRHRQGRNQQANQKQFFHGWPLIASTQAQPGPVRGPQPEPLRQQTGKPTHQAQTRQAHRAGRQRGQWLPVPGRQDRCGIP